jgi:maleylpyruvate isomerase
VPQLYDARCFECDLSVCPTIECINIACGELAGFCVAAPEA